MVFDCGVGRNASGFGAASGNGGEVSGGGKIDSPERLRQRAADTIGIRGIIVHAISAEAKNFYVALGFDVSPIEPMTLTITINDLRASIAD